MERATEEDSAAMQMDCRQESVPMELEHVAFVSLYLFTYIHTVVKTNQIGKKIVDQRLFQFKELAEAHRN